MVYSIHNFSYSLSIANSISIGSIHSYSMHSDNIILHSSYLISIHCSLYPINPSLNYSSSYSPVISYIILSISYFLTPSIISMCQVIIIIHVFMTTHLIMVYLNLLTVSFCNLIYFCPTISTLIHYFHSYLL